jgi:hypothetical protein
MDHGGPFAVAWRNAQKSSDSAVYSYFIQHDLAPSKSLLASIGGPFISKTLMQQQELAWWRNVLPVNKEFNDMTAKGSPRESSIPANNKRAGSG